MLTPKQVMCHACKSVVYEVLRPLAYGDSIEASQFRGINGYPNPSDGCIIACPNPGCGSEWGLRQGLEEVTDMSVT